jgi:pyruvate dehydrogenase E2 component (dihydrolipoamide acetyltransferase)
MTLHEVILPRTSDAMSEALLSSWLIGDGAAVSTGDVLAEVETDKAMVEVTAEIDGLVVRAVPEGTSVEIGAVLAYVLDGTDADAYREGTLQLPGTVAPESAVAESAPPANEIDAHASANAAAAPDSQQSAPSLPMVASPLARKLAREAGMRLEDLAPGSGPGGRIVRADVEARRSTGPRAFEANLHTGQTTTDKPSVRQAAMAAAMVQSTTTIPHFSVTRDIYAGALIEFRQQLKNVGATPPSFSTLFVAALALALHESPWARRTWSDDGITTHAASAIGLAVAVDETDLVVPIIRAAEFKALDEVSAELETLIDRAKARRLNPDELVGGIGSISNLGMFGIESLIPIVPPGQSFIIGLGQVRQREDGSACLTATLSGDHRVITGLGAAMLLEAFAQRCANPVGLVSELRNALTSRAP